MVSSRKPIIAITYLIPSIPLLFYVWIGLFLELSLNPLDVSSPNRQILTCLLKNGFAWLCTKSRKFVSACKHRVTLKALANVSPGFALKPWAQKCTRRLFATLKGLLGLRLTNTGATPSELRLREVRCVFPRVAKAQPWAGIGERFQRYSFPISLLKSGICAAVGDICRDLVDGN